MATKIKRPDTAFSMSSGQKRPRVEDGAHLRFVRSLPCIICGKPGPSHAAHVRFGSLPHGKRDTGAGEKPSDKWTLPLCVEHHVDGTDSQHASGERKWWRGKGIDPLCVAALLYCASGDETAGREIVAGARAIVLWGR